MRWYRGGSGAAAARFDRPKLVSRLCVRFGPVPRVAASSHSCLDRFEKRACRAVTAAQRDDDGAASIVAYVDCTLLLQRRYVAQDRLA
jgi:hypothetical protein